jgi:tRNA-2-methylthio-N6-dimethylallyladenosine synthase
MINYTTNFLDLKYKMKKKLFIKTYGCQMNVYDSIKMEDLLEPHGYSGTDKMEEADLIILNTCHIREKASEKVYSELGRIKKIKDKNKNIKDTKIAVAGCVAQAEGEEIFSRAPFVDVVVGPQTYHELPELLANLSRKDKRAISLDFIEEEKFDKLPEFSKTQGASSFVSIQEGCDKFCTFCVVPYTRGAEFSRPLEKIYREILDYVSKGSKEIILLGQNVNAYHGKDPESNECDLARLIEKISDIKGLERIRYTTSHPRDMNESLIKIHGTCSKLMPFLHLPVQSGSNKILQLMNRKHNRDQYFDIIDSLRSARPDIAFSSDFIVGFPEETDEDFQDTLDLVKKVKFAQCYSFKYSVRPGTPASTRKQIPENIKTERLIALQQLLQYQQKEYNESFKGKILPILFDRDGKYSDQIIGKTEYMQSVYITSLNKESLIGNIYDVEITDSTTNSLTGTLLSKTIKNL